MKAKNIPLANTLTMMDMPLAKLKTKRKKRRILTMIKCPHCGSTAQVKQESGNTYSCGCGCWFTVIQKENQEKK